MESAAALSDGRELDDLSSDCDQWGRYNVHYLEQDAAGERTGDKRPLRPKVSSSSEPGGSRIKRHVSDAAKTGAVKNRNRVGRRQSEGPNGSSSTARSKIVSSSQDAACRFANSTAASSSCLEPCLRLSIIRHESDLRKKRVAFSDAPAVVWNDPPVILFSPSNTLGHQHAAGQASSSSHRRHSYPCGAADGASEQKEGVQQQSEAAGVLTPKERRRRKVVMAVVCTTFILLTASALFVLITLFNASAIDEAGNSLLALRVLQLH